MLARIRSVDRAANLQTKLYTVTLSVPADVTGLLSGMFADVTFHTETSENAIVVPSDAILTNGDLQYVFVVEEDTAKYTEVTTGLTGNGVTEVTSGLVRRTAAGHSRPDVFNRRYSRANRVRGGITIHEYFQVLYPA